jgi:predicted nucleic acid-binding protein
VSERIPIVAVLDTNVLVPASTRDILLWMAFTDVFEPRWSDSILNELRRTLVGRGFTDADRAARLIETMDARFPRANFRGGDQLIALLTNDPDDRHVLATAVASEASIIVTHNTRHFRRIDLEPHGITIQTPDRFLEDRFREQPERILSLLRRQASILRSPPMTVQDVLSRLRIHAPTFVERVSAMIDADQ